MTMVFCMNCGRYFNSGVPKVKSEDKEKKMTVPFCSEECRKSYA